MFENLIVALQLTTAEADVTEGMMGAMPTAIVSSRQADDHAVHARHWQVVDSDLMSVLQERIALAAGESAFLP